MKRLIDGVLSLMVLAGVLAIFPAGLKAGGLSICDNTPGNIVQNCGFETGNFTDWVASTTSSDPWDVTSNDPNSGTYAASTGCVGDQCITGTSTQQAYLYQILATNAGDDYDLQFSFASAGTPMELQVLWDGTVELDLTGIPSGGYITYSAGDLLGTGSDELEFLGQQNPGFDRLDDVIVTDAGPSGSTPEPSSFALMIGAALLAATFSRKFGHIG